MPRKKEEVETPEVEEAEETTEVVEEVEEAEEEVAEATAEPEVVTCNVQGQMVTGTVGTLGGRKVLVTPAGVTYDI